MNRKRFILIYLLLLCFLLPGCSKKKAPSSAALDIATSINICCRYRQTHLQRSYTSTDKIDIILQYLHKISPKGRAEEDPELLQGDFCNITIHLTGGTQRIYRIKDNCFFSIDYRPWQAIDSEQGNILFHLINHIPSDHETNAVFAAYRYPPIPAAPEPLYKKLGLIVRPSFLF